MPISWGKKGKAMVNIRRGWVERKRGKGRRSDRKSGREAKRKFTRTELRKMANQGEQNMKSCKGRG